MFEIQDWGLIDYQLAWDRQKDLVSIVQKERNRNILIFCEHPSVITIGKSGTADNLIASSGFLTKAGIKVIETDRGGDVTLHNPQQLVGYMVFDLSSLKEDLHWFLRSIENIIIDLLSGFNINSHTIEGMTGVWVQNKRKICAMGMHCSRWVTSHGFALNVNNNLDEFNYIVPCGIKNKEVSSISKETGMVIDIEKVNPTDFGDASWDFRQLTAYKDLKKKYTNPYTLAGFPFIVSLTELMRAKKSG